MVLCLTYYLRLKFKTFLFQDIKNDEVYEVCLHAFNRNDASNHIQPGNCLKCGSYCDLKSSRATVDKALICIKRYALFNLYPNK